MSFDSLTLRIVVHEMSQSLIGGTIRHIEQTNPTTFSIKISQKAKTQWMVMSDHSVHARAHLIQKPPPGQKQSYFADFLSTHLKQGIITGISQLGWDRILKISVQPKSDDHLQTNKKSIIAEIMGKHSNIILMDDTDDRILECLKHIDETKSRYREVLPGETYTLPPQQEKLDPFEINESSFSALFHSTDITWKSLFNKIDGLSPTLAKEIIARSEKTGLYDAFQQVIAYFAPEDVSPQLIIDRDEPVAASPMPLQQYPASSIETFSTMSETLSAYYERISNKEKKESELRSLKQVVQTQMNQLKRKTNALQKDLENAERADDYRIQGELILANLHNIKRGQKEVKLQNYYSEELETLTIALNPELNPSDNAQTFFKKYTKAKRGYSQIQQRLAELEAEKEILYTYQNRIETAVTLEELQQIRKDFIENGLIITQQKRKSQQQISEGPYRKYTSTNGFQIYVGRNSQANDLLLRQIAKPRDMWLHAKQIHGSHVLIRNPENRQDIPMPTLLQAAQLAAYYSKAHHSSLVPVDYTWARYVVKRKGNAAGYVHYTHEKTLYVEPSVFTKDAN